VEIVHENSYLLLSKTQLLTGHVLKTKLSLYLAKELQLKKFLCILFVCMTQISIAKAIEIESLECTITNPAGVSYFTLDPQTKIIGSTTYSVAGYFTTEFEMLNIDNNLEVYGQNMVRLDLMVSNEPLGGHILLLNGRLEKGDQKTLYGTFGKTLSAGIFMGIHGYAPQATAQCRFLTL
jgi:hypothetical protein